MREMREMRDMSYKELEHQAKIAELHIYESIRNQKKNPYNL